VSAQNFQNYYKNLLGEEEFDLFRSALNKFYPKAFRINTLKWTVSDFQKWAKKEGWKVEKIPFCKDGFYINLPENLDKPLGNTIPHLAGYGYIQGATSMYPVELLNVQEGDVVLDLCSSPGGKTTHIAEKLKNRGFVIANEISPARIIQLKENIYRLGIWNYAVTNLNPSYFEKNYRNIFDRILVDAPCSGEGMIAKSNEVMQRWDIKYIEGFARMQVKILSSAFEALKPDGHMVYSTCTMNEVENEGVLNEMEKIYGKSFKVLKVKKFWPHKDNVEGFFSALITKKSDGYELVSPNLRYQNNRKISEGKRLWNIYPYKKSHEILKRFAKFFGFELPEFFKNITVVEHENTLWIQSSIFWNFFRFLPVKSLGLPFAKKRREHDIDFVSDISNAFGYLFKNFIKLDDKQAEQFLSNNEVKGDFGDKRISALKNDIFAIGIAKASGERVIRVKS